jgi:hypothetical protein
LNRLWDQIRPDDAGVPMPLYEGEIEPRRWAPGRRP